jgi:hypothetical protein
MEIIVLQCFIAAVVIGATMGTTLTLVANGIESES